MHAEFLEKSGCLAVQLELKNGCQINPSKLFLMHRVKRLEVAKCCLVLLLEMKFPQFLVPEAK